MAGTAGASSGISGAVERAYAIAPDPGTSYLDAEHIVILMQENRSFDHMFGTLQGVRGFNDPRAIRQADGASIFLQRDRGGNGFLPWRLDLKDSRITWMGSLDHSRHGQIDAWNGGHHNFWIEAKRHGNSDYADIPMTMGYFTREDLPFYYALADAFTICDQNYCSIMTSTAPNRLMLWTGTVREEHDAGSLVYMRNEQTHPCGLSWTTYGERLQKAGISWKCYQNQIWCEGGLTGEADQWLGNDGDNPLERFQNYVVSFSDVYRTYVNDVIDKAQVNITRRENILQQALLRADVGSPNAAELEAWLRGYADQRSRLERKRASGDRSLADLTTVQRLLRGRGLSTNSKDPDYLSLETVNVEIEGNAQTMTVPKGDVLHQFREDVRTGRLPTVSWLVASANFSAHPSRPWYGAWYASEIMNILTGNPEIWKKTIFILTYDENDGYFDHAPSFVAADPKRPETGGASAGIDTGSEYSYVEDELIQGVPEELARSGPIGLGYRVPMIIASPWSRGGWVNSQISDHTSVIRLIEQFIDGKYGKKVVETNISSWRRTVCGDLTSNFRSYNEQPAALPFLERAAHLQAIESARQKPLPSGYRALSQSGVAALTKNPTELRSRLWQEPGTRPACALPYELYADGVLDRDQGQFCLYLKAATDLFGNHSAGAPFNVYLYGTKAGNHVHEIAGLSKKMMAATYAVRAGDQIKKEIDLSRFSSGEYDIAIHGPNGFYRNFTGRPDEPEVEVRCLYRSDKDGTGVEIHLTNRAQISHEIVVEYPSYGEPPQRVMVNGLSERVISLNLDTNSQWYDFCVTVKGHISFARRYAGHMETGMPSFTDPTMGRHTAGS